MRSIYGAFVILLMTSTLSHASDIFEVAGGFDSSNPSISVFLKAEYMGTGFESVKFFKVKIDSSGIQNQSAGNLRDLIPNYLDLEITPVFSISTDLLEPKKVSEMRFLSVQFKKDLALGIDNMVRITPITWTSNSTFGITDGIDLLIATSVNFFSLYTLQSSLPFSDAHTIESLRASALDPSLSIGFQSQLSENTRLRISFNGQMIAGINRDQMKFDERFINAFAEIKLELEKQTGLIFQMGLRSRESNLNTDTPTLQRQNYIRAGVFTRL
jgi:hypothetical protein